MAEDLNRKLSTLSSSPGVYLMKDAKGRVIYIGKARELKRRVSSYFRKSGQKDQKRTILVKRVHDFDTILTNTEKEALILESNLIKRHLPRYNVILKDDKRYPCLRLDIKSAYPNIRVVRKIEKDGALYFGPYPSVGAVRETLRVIHSTFKIRKCKPSVLKPRPRPCLNYQMGLCLGPCSRPVGYDDYAEVIREVIMFLKGRMPDLIEKARMGMEYAAANEDFEAAAIHRDRMFALETTLEKQAVTAADLKDRDVFGFARQGPAAFVTVLFVRGGFLLGNRPLYVPDSILPEGEMITSFVKQYYGTASFIPDEILLSVRLEDRAVMEEWLSDLKGKRVHLLTPQRGEKADLSRMACQNATKGLKEELDKNRAEDRLLERTQKRLGLRRRPERIECFDLSSLAGSEAVGTMVVFENGRPARESYRRYRIKRASGRDDYAMLAEVLGRRYNKAGPKRPAPDLLMVDGGKGQLNQAAAAIDALGLGGSFDIIGIAKKDPHRGEGGDKIYRPGRKNPLTFARYADVLLFLQRIRDEAHRFAIAYQRKRRLMSQRHSPLQTIPGIGEKRRMLLLKRFGSLKRIKEASLDEMAAIPGMTRQAAERVHEFLNSRD